MAFIPVTNTAEVEIRALLAGEKVENTLWFLAAAPFSPSSILELASDVRTWWVANLIPHVPTEYLLVEIHAKDHTSDSGLEATLAPVGTVTGLGGVMFPGNVSFAVSFRTGHAGRSFRGRNYLPGVPESAKASPNTLTPVYTGAIVAGYEQLLAAGTLTSATWVVASRFSGVDPTTGKPIPRPAGITTPIVSVLAVDNNIDSQRRRLAGRGA